MAEKCCGFDEGQFIRCTAPVDNLKMNAVYKATRALFATHSPGRFKPWEPQAGDWLKGKEKDGGDVQILGDSPQFGCHSWYLKLEDGERGHIHKKSLSLYYLPILGKEPGMAPPPKPVTKSKPDFEKGDRVVVISAKKHKEFVGKEGVVDGVDMFSGLVYVKLDKIYAIRPEQLKKVEEKEEPKTVEFKDPKDLIDMEERTLRERARQNFRTRTDQKMFETMLQKRHQKEQDTLETLIQAKDLRVIENFSVWLRRDTMQVMGDENLKTYNRLTRE